MRDPNRIYPLLDKLARAWKKQPDLRFGQFMTNLFYQCGRDPFYIEDDVWEVALDALIRGEDPAEAIRSYKEP